MTKRARAALSGLQIGRQRGRFVIDDASLALNLSFVLHERSDSRAVLDTVQRIRAHERRAQQRSDPSSLTLVSNIQDDGTSEVPDVILTTTLGLPDLLPSALQRSGWPNVPIISVDCGDPTQRADFFRSDALLVLPEPNDTNVAVTALVLRPGGRSAHLRHAGSFVWPSQRHETLSAIETLIQAYADQWMPTRSLWPAPAEVMLEDEVS